MSDYDTEYDVENPDYEYEYEYEPDDELALAESYDAGPPGLPTLEDMVGQAVQAGSKPS